MSKVYTSAERVIEELISDFRTESGETIRYTKTEDGFTLSLNESYDIVLGEDSEMDEEKYKNVVIKKLLELSSPERVDERYRGWGGDSLPRWERYSKLKTLIEDAKAMEALTFELDDDHWRNITDNWHGVYNAYIPELDELPDPSDPLTEENLRSFMQVTQMDSNGENVEISRNGDNFYITLEAPNHSTIGITSNIYDGMGYFYREVVRLGEDFNAEDEYNKLWSAEFGSMNNFTPTSFAEALKEDEEYYNSLAGEMIGYS